MTGRINNPRLILILIVSVLFNLVTGCNGGSKNPWDGEEETSEALDQADPHIETTGEDSFVEIIEEEESGEDIEEEVIEPFCGNSIIDEGEACDDGNNVTEFCGRSEDCLGDCSLLAAGRNRSASTQSAMGHTRSGWHPNSASKRSRELCELVSTIGAWRSTCRSSQRRGR